MESRIPKYIRFAVVYSAWLYLVAVTAVWMLMYWAGDRWWLATLILFGPRWVCALPLFVLVPAALWWHRRSLWPLAPAVAIVVWPLMGLCLPWGAVAGQEGPLLRVLSCNVKGKCRDNAALEVLIREALPDIVGLEGCWGEVQIDWPPGWNVVQEGEIIVASRFPLSDAGSVRGPQPPHHWPRVNQLRCVVDAPGGKIHFVAVHLPSPHNGISHVLDRATVIRPERSYVMDDEAVVREQASEAASRWADAVAESMILAGDFNMPVESPIYRSCWARFSNAFSRSGLGFGFTEWPTIRGWRFGIRIDHILLGPGWRARRCWVGPDIGSDHLPILADLAQDSPLSGG
jgi:vancomycin resistance protein VanJ